MKKFIMNKSVTHNGKHHAKGAVTMDENMVKLGHADEIDFQDADVNMPEMDMPAAPMEDAGPEVVAVKKKPRR